MPGSRLVKRHHDLYPGISDFALPSDLNGVVDLDTKIPHRAFNSMACRP
jgi:hypothetical protein